MSTPAPTDGEDAVSNASSQVQWDAEERALIARVINSFLSYAVYQHRNVTDAKRVAFFALPRGNRELLLQPPFNFAQRMQATEDAIDTNSNCALDIAKTGLLYAGLADLVPAALEHPVMINNLPCLPGLEPNIATSVDLNNASSTIRHLYREWSAEGAAERELCFQPILNFLDTYFNAIPPEKRHTIKILNPGCGLGRFVFELACLGYNAEGIEFSYHMLFGAMHMMNSVTRKHQYRIHPFVLGGSNHVCEADRMRHIMVPDIYPREHLSTLAIESEVPVPERLGISSGDFILVYNRPEKRETFNVLATVFFLDTAKNPLAYIETAYNCLCAGGLWINLGPLKWHFEHDSGPSKSIQASSHQRVSASKSEFLQDYGVGEPGAVELSEEDVLQLLAKYGFNLIHYEKPSQRSTGYIHNQKSMETTIFQCSFWVARKRSVAKDA